MNSDVIRLKFIQYTSAFTIRNSSINARHIFVFINILQKFLIEIFLLFQELPFSTFRSVCIVSIFCYFRNCALFSFRLCFKTFFTILGIAPLYFSFCLCCKTFFAILVIALFIYFRFVCLVN